LIIKDNVKSNYIYVFKDESATSKLPTLRIEFKPDDPRMWREWRICHSDTMINKEKESDRIRW